MITVNTITFIMSLTSTCPSIQLPILQGVEKATKTAEEYETLRIAVKGLVMQEWFSRHKSRKHIKSNGRQKIYIFGKQNVDPRHDDTCPYCLNNDICCWEHEELFEKTSFTKLVNEEVIKQIGPPPDDYSVYILFLTLI